MRINKKLTRREFEGKFGTEEKCFLYLAKTKWQDGYTCKKCGSNSYIKGRKPYSRRCGKCYYDESPTADTLFHKVKFGLSNAFGMVYDIATSKKGANSIWLAERYGVRQKCAWLFRQKVQRAMKSSKQYKLEGKIDVDELEIGTPKKDQQGRSYSTDKIRIVIAVENRDGRSGRAYAQTIMDFSSRSLGKIFKTHIAKDAEVRSDGWTGYKTLKDEYPNLTQELSNQ